MAQVCTIIDLCIHTMGAESRQRISNEQARQDTKISYLTGMLQILPQPDFNAELGYELYFDSDY